VKLDHGTKTEKVRKKTRENHVNTTLREKEKEMDILSFRINEGIWKMLLRWYP
jgi:hypothetical protein